MHCEILAGRYEDHVKLVMKAADYAKEVTVALPSVSKAVYIGLTGENISLNNISAEPYGKTVEEGDIPRIAQPLNYIEHLESDIPNIQVDRTRSASTDGIEIKNRMRIDFHTMSLPGANLVWHCPYILLFHSDNGRVNGPNYHEYDMIKLNGEDQGKVEFADNRFIMKKKADFPGWEEWKNRNREGVECTVFLEKKGNRISLKTENMGLSIENTTTINEDVPKVYLAFTGDQVALTDIRIG